MSTRRVCLFLLMSIAAASGADKDKTFRVGPASSYPNKQTNDKLTIAAVPYLTAEMTKTAFGKVNPYELGVLPVLVVLQNDTGKTVNLGAVEFEYVTPANEHVEATPAKDVPYLEGARPPKLGGSPIPNPIPRSRKRKNKLDIWEIEGRALNVKMLPAGEAANGFVYFQTGHRRGSRLYISGIREAATGKEFFFFEIGLGE